MTLPRECLVCSVASTQGSTASFLRVAGVISQTRPQLTWQSLERTSSSSAGRGASASKSFPFRSLHLIRWQCKKRRPHQGTVECCLGRETRLATKWPMHMSAYLLLPKCLAAGALPSISQITDNRCTDAGHVNLVIVIVKVFGKMMILSMILEAFQAKANSNSRTIAVLPHTLHGAIPQLPQYSFVRFKVHVFDVFDQFSGERTGGTGPGQLRHPADTLPAPPGEGAKSMQKLSKHATNMQTCFLFTCSALSSSDWDRM